MWIVRQALRRPHTEPWQHPQTGYGDPFDKQMIVDIFPVIDITIVIVDASNKVHIRPVKVAESDGKTVWISDGLASGETVVLNPIANVIEGSVVEPVRATK